MLEDEYEEEEGVVDDMWMFGECDWTDEMWETEDCCWECDGTLCGCVDWHVEFNYNTGGVELTCSAFVVHL